MPRCPICATPLHTVRQREGIYFHCPTCTGRTVTLPQIRRVTGDRFASRLVRRINSSAHLAELRCPFCTRRMRRLHSESPRA